MFGQRLRLARKRAGLSMRELADAMSPKVTAQAISKYEAGKMLPSSAVLVGLGKVLDVSLDFLMSAQVEALEAVEFRKHSRASARDRAKAEAVVMDNLERYLAIEQILDIETSVEWVEGAATTASRANPRSTSGPMSFAVSGISASTRSPACASCSKTRGIKVVEADLPESINGLSCHALRGGEIVAEAVVVSSRINVERKRFTLAHELAHRIIRSTGNPAIDLERAMNRFAGAFLVPGQSLRDEVGAVRHRITYYEIVRLKQNLRRVGHGPADASGPGGRSVRGILTARLRDLRPVLAQVGAGSDSTRPWVRGPSRSLVGFKRLVSRAVGEELISPVRAAALLGQSLESVERQISGPAIQ